MAIRVVVAVAMVLAAVASATSRSKQKDKQVYDYHIGQFAGMAEEEIRCQFADMVEEKVGCQVSSCYIPEYDNDMMNPKYRLAVDKYMQDDDDLPQRVDWRSKGAVTSVKDQRSCEGCWSFSAAAAIEGLHYIDNGDLIPLSVQQLLDCSSMDRGCAGGNAANAFHYVRQDGLVSWDTMPFEGWHRTCRFQLDPIVLLTDYEIVKPYNTRALMRAVARQPVVVTLHTNKLFTNYTEGVFRGPCGGQLNHQATLVGYDTTPEGLDFWIVKNSWGTGFGQEGYINIERGYDEEGGLCGILKYSVYPIGVVTVED